MTAEKRRERKEGIEMGRREEKARVRKEGKGTNEGVTTGKLRTEGEEGEGGRRAVLKSDSSLNCDPRD